VTSSPEIVPFTMAVLTVWNWDSSWLMLATEFAMSASAPSRTDCTVLVAWLSAVTMSLADVTAACARVALSVELAYCCRACFSLLS